MLANDLRMKYRKKAGRTGRTKKSMAQSRTSSAKARVASRKQYAALSRGMIISNPTRATAVELKGVDTIFGNGSGALTLANAVTASTGTCCLNLIQTGAGFYNRVGRKINLKSLRLKYTIDYVYATVSEQADANSVRVAVVWDRNPSGASALPVFNEIFAYTPQSGNPVGLWNAPQSYATMDRFVILRDRVIDFTPPSYPSNLSSANEMTQTIDEYISLEGLETVYSSNANPPTIANIYSGALYLVTQLAYNPAADSSVLLDPSSIARLRYYD